MQLVSLKNREQRLYFVYFEAISIKLPHFVNTILELLIHAESR